MATNRILHLLPTGPSLDSFGFLLYVEVELVTRRGALSATVVVVAAGAIMGVAAEIARGWLKGSRARLGTEMSKGSRDTEKAMKN